MRDNLTRAIVGVTIALALLAIGGILVFGSIIGPKETEPLIALAWIQPTAQSFQLLSAFAIALLCFGRYRALGSAWLFWTGTVFLANAVLGVFYLLSWPGLIGERGVIARLSNTASWFFLLVYSCIAVLILAVNAHRPERLKSAYAVAGYALAAALAATIGLLSILFESALPTMVVGLRYTPFNMVLGGSMIVLTAVAAASAYRRYAKGEDRMLGYLALFVSVMALGILNGYIGGKRYDYFWYTSRLIYISAYLFMLFGLLQEGYALFSGERERAAELDAANKELAAFTYAVAHDLRSPVRHVDGFSKALSERYADQLDERGQQYLQYVREGSVKMGQLIDDLLTLTNVARREMRHTTVDLSQMAQEIATELRNEQPERQVEFVIAPGIVANGDAGMLRIALGNLLDNAWKFTSRRPTATIEFGVGWQDDKAVYYVKDNGAGFDRAYADKLFRAFERLHSADDFPGTGVGLATVERIIRRHGGRVWAEGEVNKGATFYFTLG